MADEQAPGEEPGEYTTTHGVMCQRFDSEGTSRKIEIVKFENGLFGLLLETIRQPGDKVVTRIILPEDSIQAIIHCYAKLVDNPEQFVVSKAE